MGSFEANTIRRIRMKKFEAMVCYVRSARLPEHIYDDKKRGLVKFVLAVGFLMSVHLIGQVGCLIPPPKPDDLIAAAQEEISNNLRRLDEQGSVKPAPLSPLGIDLHAIESQVIKLNRGGSGGHGGSGGGSGGGGRG